MKTIRRAYVSIKDPTKHALPTSMMRRRGHMIINQLVAMLQCNTSFVV